MNFVQLLPFAIFVVFACGAWALELLGSAIERDPRYGIARARQSRHYVEQHLRASYQMLFR